MTDQTAGEVWQHVLEQLKDMTADFASYCDHVAVSAKGSLVVHFRKAYTLQKEACEQPARKAQLEGALEAFLGRPIRLEMAVLPEAESPALPPPPSMFQLMRAKESHWLVRQAVELFDAEVLRVDVPRALRAPVNDSGAARAPESG